MQSLANITRHRRDPVRDYAEKNHPDLGNYATKLV